MLFRSERIYNGAMCHMVTLLARLTQRATGIADPIEIRLMSMGLIGQTMVLRSARAAIHRGLQVTEIDAQMQQRICNRVRNNVMAMLAAARIDE